MFELPPPNWPDPPLTSAKCLRHHHRQRHSHDAYIELPQDQFYPKAGLASFSFEDLKNTTPLGTDARFAYILMANVVFKNGPASNAFETGCAGIFILYGDPSPISAYLFFFPASNFHRILLPTNAFLLSYIILKSLEKPEK